jgi:hypothetical protein
VQQEFWLVNGLDRKVFAPLAGDFNKAPRTLESEPRFEESQDCLIARNANLVRLHPARFGEAEQELILKKRDGSQELDLELILRVTLEGDPAGWKHAKPVLMRSTDNPKDKKGATIKGHKIEQHFPLTAVDFLGRPTFDARVLDGTAMFNGENVEPQPAKLELEGSPRISSMMIELDSHELRVRALTKFWPKNAPIKFVVGLDSATSVPAAFRYARTLDGLGLTDREGEVGAKAPLKSFAVGQTYTVTALAAVKGSIGSLGGLPILPVSKQFTRG